MQLPIEVPDKTYGRITDDALGEIKISVEEYLKHLLGEANKIETTRLGGASGSPEIIKSTVLQASSSLKNFFWRPRKPFGIKAAKIVSVFSIFLTGKCLDLTGMNGERLIAYVFLAVVACSTTIYHLISED